jgi:predicted anti-sigma-YlaC factor YlaD
VNAETQCDEIRALTSELALGIADGEDRARVLEHVRDCAECREELERFSVLADELLVLAPEHEPPIGFELRTLDALQPPARRRRSWRWPALVVASAALAAFLSVGGVLVATRDERHLAAQYRATLEQAHGSSFTAVPLRNAAGAAAGTLFVYRGSPSWIFGTLPSASASDVTRAQIVTRDDRRVPLSAFHLTSWSWGGALPVNAASVAAVHLLDARGRTALVGYLPQSC